MRLTDIAASDTGITVLCGEEKVEEIMPVSRTMVNDAKPAFVL